MSGGGVAVAGQFPWTLELADGTVVTETLDGRDRGYPGLFDRPDIVRFSFRTPVGAIGIDHATGTFFAFNQVRQHPDYRAEFRGGYRHYHRVRKFFDMGIGADCSVRILHYVIGMERDREDGSREFLIAIFPPDVRAIDQIDVVTRVVDVKTRQQVHEPKAAGPTEVK